MLRARCARQHPRLGELDDLPGEYQTPKTTRGYICEFKLTQEEILRILGRAVHVFLLDIPRFEFAAIIPKGPFATVVMVGEDLDQELVHAFLNDPVVRRTFPTDTADRRQRRHPS